jgi:hypothetical protein
MGFQILILRNELFIINIKWIYNNYIDGRD